MRNVGAGRILGPDPEGAEADAKPDREEVTMMSPTQISASSLRCEEILVDNARKRLATHAYQSASQPRCADADSIPARRRGGSGRPPLLPAPLRTSYRS